MILLKIVIEIKPQKKTEFLQTMNSLILTAPPEEGCSKRTVYQRLNDENAYCCVQTWNSKEKLERYMSTDRFKALQGAMQLLGEVKELSMNTLS
jgi:quinol monooxygenase YgiN